MHLFNKLSYFEFSPRSDIFGFPFDRLLNAWMKCGFSPSPSREALKYFINTSLVSEDYFDFSGFASGGYFLSKKGMYPTQDGWTLGATIGGTSTSFHATLPNEDVPVIFELLRSSLRSGDLNAVRKRFGFLDDAFFENPPEIARAIPWERASQPGIYRREHASLVIRSETTSLLIDPVSLCRALPAINSIPLSAEAERHDAVLITHGHGDHWHMPSLLYAVTDKTTPVLVPHMKRTNLLTFENFKSSLELAGQATLSPKWGQTVRIGDIEIDVLPFHGEQPSCDPPGAPSGMGNIGNCYRVTTPQFSALILVDTGRDPKGNMLDVITRSYEEKGPVDCVLSCLRTFASPFFGGLNTYFAALPFDQLTNMYRQYRAGALPSTTAGPAGAADLCKAARARFYLPYANGFSGIGEVITDIGWGTGEPSEKASLQELRAAITAGNGKTEIIPWIAGDAATFRNGEILVVASTRDSGRRAS